MKKPLSEALEAVLIPKVKLVHPDDCSCSKEDLREFGCLCGSPRPPQGPTKPSLQIYEDRSGSIDHELYQEFLKLLAELK